MKTIVITGGKLAKLLKPKLEEINWINSNFSIIITNKKECNVCSYDSISAMLLRNKPSAIIHTAALTHPMEDHDSFPLLSLSNNVLGTTNMAMGATELRSHLFFISTDYVYPGDQELSLETSLVAPTTNYGKSKLAGEVAVSMVPSHTIFRAAFTERPFKHEAAVTDSYKSYVYNDTAADYISKIVAYRLYSEEEFGITINIGGPRMSIHEFASIESSTPKKEITREELFRKTGYSMPLDTSMDLRLMLDYLDRYEKETNLS